MLESVISGKYLMTLAGNKVARPSMKLLKARAAKKLSINFINTVERACTSFEIMGIKVWGEGMYVYRSDQFDRIGYRRGCKPVFFRQQTISLSPF